MTNSIDIEILEGNGTAVIADDLKLDDTAIVQDSKKYIKPQTDENRLYITAIRKAGIDDKLFCLLIFILMISIFLSNIWSVLLQLKNNILGWLQFKYFLITAKKRFNYAAEHSDAESVYLMFKKFNEEIAIKHFLKNNFSKNNSLKNTYEDVNAVKKHQDWLSFYLEVQELKFSSDFNLFKQHFVTRAIAWIDYMRNVR